MLMLPNFMCHNTSHKGHNMVHKFIYSQTQDSLVTMLTTATRNALPVTRAKGESDKFQLSWVVHVTNLKKKEKKKKRPTAIEFPGKEPAKHKNNQSKTYLIDPKQNCTLKLLKISSF